MYSPEVELRFIELKKALAAFKASRSSRNAANLTTSSRNLAKVSESLADWDPVFTGIQDLTRFIEDHLSPSTERIERRAQKVAEELDHSAGQQPFQTLTAIFEFLSRHETDRFSLGSGQ